MSQTAVSSVTGAIGGAMLPFPVGEARASADFAELDRLVGNEFFAPDGRMVRLVRLDLAAGLVASGSTAPFAYRNVMEYSSRTLFDVKPCTATTSRPCGVTVPHQVALSDNDLFWVVIQGRAEIRHSDDATSIAAGDHVVPDGNTGDDNGSVKTSTTTDTSYLIVGKAIEVIAADGDTGTIEISPKLVG